MTSKNGIQLGRMNRLQVVKSSDFGMFLDGYDDGEILLPKRYVDDGIVPGEWVEVFIYADSEDRLVATTETPKAMVGEVAYLKVVAVNKVGAFLDWGLPKDLLVPFSEQSPHMREGYSYSVFIYRDRYNDRIVASSKLSNFLPEETDQYQSGDSVELLACSKSELGFKCLIDEKVLGLLHHGDVFQPLKPGQKLNAYIKRVREDGRIDLMLTAPGSGNKQDLETQILDYLQAQGGRAEIGDKTPPEEIYRIFHASKKNYKRALSGLYKGRKVTISGNSVELC
ncbi:MAG: S1-like domain-containing RNA-binding protein [Halioglobus sp.]